MRKVRIARDAATAAGPAESLAQKPPDGSEEQSTVVHPHLPMAVSAGIYATAILAIVALFVVSRYYV